MCYIASAYIDMKMEITCININKMTQYVLNEYPDADGGVIFVPWIFVYFISTLQRYAIQVTDYTLYVVAAFGLFVPV